MQLSLITIVVLRQPLYFHVFDLSDKVRKEVLGFGVLRVWVSACKGRVVDNGGQIIWGKFFFIQLQMMLVQEQAGFQPPI